jgi:hypothetical protein
MGVDCSLHKTKIYFIFFPLGLATSYLRYLSAHASLG